MTTDEYLDVLTLRPKCWFRGELKDMDVEMLCWWFSCSDEGKEINVLLVVFMFGTSK